MTVFEPKAPLSRRDTTEPKQQTSLNIKCLKWDLKDSRICLDYFQPNFWGSLSHLSIFLIDAVWFFFLKSNKNSFLKNASITHIKFVETRPRDNNILYKKIYTFIKKKISYEMDRIALFRFVFWRNKIHFSKNLSIFLYSRILLKEDH